MCLHILFLLASIRRIFYTKTNPNNVTIHGPYDYMSIMHPPWDWFSFGPGGNAPGSPQQNKNTFGISAYDQQVTIETINKNYRYEIGQRRGLSYWDQRKLNEYFRCTKDQFGTFFYGIYFFSYHWCIQQ